MKKEILVNEWSLNKTTSKKIAILSTLLTQGFDPNAKMRIVIDYDPQKSTHFKYYKVLSQDDQESQEKS